MPIAVKMEDKTIQFLLEVGKLKRAKRTGWVLKGIKNSESIADHVFRTIILLQLLDIKNNINSEKCSYT